MHSPYFIFHEGKDPINLALCKWLKKTMYEGKACIRFHGCNATWVFENTLERDKEFNKIIGHLSNESTPDKPTPGLEAPELEYIREGYDPVKR